ncbi:hypothetical protein SLEP1_g23936 [Rubroshorea leprosula]|uniref:Uncharacterized protein n=1 Tax=Rubroshorea leprosula TaxID=152421 RepID=A0AAV5JMQ4_9ROSI|nr:hypothetical protein SLEP1_g23936 [Rubroshorea leprosula]
MASSFSPSSSSEQVSSLFSSISSTSFTTSSNPTIPNFPIIPSLSTIGTYTFSTPNTIYPTHHNTIPSIFSHPVFTVSNIKTFVPETLTHENYAIWKELMFPVFKSKGVYGHIDGTDPRPPPTSPNFEAWMQIDFQILSWIHAAISTEVGCLDSCRFTSGYCLFFGRSLISWSSKKQHTVARSSAEAEYRAMANAVAKVIWVRQLLAALRFLLSSPPVLYCDNLSAIYLSLNPIQHQRRKHIEIDIRSVRERVASRFILLQHVPFTLQRADILTKALSTTAFCSQRSNLCVLCNPAQIAGG